MDKKDGMSMTWNNRIFIFRDVIFFEDLFPFKLEGEQGSSTNALRPHATHHHPPLSQTQ